MIWTIGTAYSTLEHAERLELSKPPALEWLNLRDFYGAAPIFGSYPDHESWEMPHAAFSQVPTPKLKTIDPTYRPNYFGMSIFHFVSARLRAVFENATDRVRFRPIDTSQSVPEVQAVGYQMVDVLAFGNPWDTSRMPGAERDARQPDGSLKREWILDYAQIALAGPNKNIPIFYRDDFVPPAPIFRATGSMWTFVTDDMADLITAAGIDDVDFRDLTDFTPGVGPAYRKPR